MRLKHPACMAILIYGALFVGFMSAKALGDELLGAKTLRALPTSSEGGVSPRLELRWSDTDPEQFELLATLHSRTRSMLFNPFGLVAIGCPYYIIIADAQGNPVGQVSRPLPANQSIPSPDAWVYVGHKRVVGRVFPRCRDFSLIKPNEVPAEAVDPAYKLDLVMMGDDGEPVPDPVVLRAGEYFLYLLVTQRLEGERLFFSNGKGVPRAQQKWLTGELDTVVCRSQPVPILVGSEGKVQKPEEPQLMPPAPIRLTAEIQDTVLKLEAVRVTQERHLSLDPGLAADGIFGIDVTDSNGRSLVSPFGSGVLVADHMRMKCVPKGAIVGYAFEGNSPLAVGQYEVSVKFPPDLWVDRKVDASLSDTSARFDIFEEQIRSGCRLVPADQAAPE